MAARELSRLGLEAMHRDEFPEAQIRFTEALKTNPDDVESRRNLARVLWKQGRTDRAIAELDDAIRDSGENCEWIVELGKMLLAQNEYEGALECSHRALSGSSELPCAWRLQAEVFQSTGRMDEALQAYHQALARGDESVEVLSQIATIYRSQGRDRRALSTLQRMEDQLPVEQHPQELGYWQGLALQAMGRHEDAVQQFMASRGKMGDNPALLASLAGSQAELQSTARANIRVATKLAGRSLPESPESQVAAHPGIATSVVVRAGHAETRPLREPQNPHH